MVHNPLVSRGARAPFVTLLALSVFVGCGSDDGGDATAGDTDASSTSASDPSNPSDPSGDPSNGSTSEAPGSETTAPGDDTTGTSTGTVDPSTGTSTGDASFDPTPDVVGNVNPERMVADTTRRRIYATVGEDAAMHTDELVVVDVNSREVVGSVPAGSQPSALALSDDGSTLWVALDGSLSLQEFDVTTDPPTTLEAHALPTADLGESAVVRSMHVLAGTTQSVAMSLHRPGISPSFSGVVVVESGVELPERAPGHTGASQLSSGPEGWLFGYNNAHSGFGFYTLRVDETGVAEQVEHSGLISGYGSDIVYGDGRVYATSGQVVDVSDPAAPVVAGTFPHTGRVLPLPESVLMFATTGLGPTLYELDPDTFEERDSTPFTLVALANVRDFIAVGDDAIGFIATGSGSDAPSAIVVMGNPF